MGTDIHSVGQIRVKGKWESVIGRPGGDDRNYDSFAVMADVRNGSGFAGVVTGEGWEVLFPKRGLPDDLDFCDEDGKPVTRDIGLDYPQVRLPEPYYYRYDTEKKSPQHTAHLGDHSFSWLTLVELKHIRDHYADKKYKHIGFISPEAQENLDKGINPTEWCGGTNQEGWVQREWYEPAADCLYTLNRFIEALEAVANENECFDEDVRLVFGFDS